MGKNLDLHLYATGNGNAGNDTAVATGADGQLLYGYLEYRPAAKDSYYRIGRLVYREGVAAGQIDGVMGGFAPAPWCSIAAAVGSTVTPSGDSSGSIEGGTRVGLHGERWGELGISGASISTGTTSPLTMFGSDFWLKPISTLTLNGAVSADTVGIGEARVKASYAPSGTLALAAEYSDIRARHFYNPIAAPRLFDPFTMKDQESLELSGNWQPYGWLELSGGCKGIQQSTGVSAVKSSTEARLIGFPVQGFEGGLGYARLDSSSGELRLAQHRLFAAYDWLLKGKMARASLDLVNYRYAEPIYRKSDALELQLAATTVISKNVELTMGITYGKNPMLQQQVEGLVKLRLIYDSGKRSQ